MPAEQAKKEHVGPQGPVRTAPPVPANAEVQVQQVKSLILPYEIPQDWNYAFNGWNRTKPNEDPKENPFVPWKRDTYMWEIFCVMLGFIRISVLILSNAETNYLSFVDESILMLAYLWIGMYTLMREFQDHFYKHWAVFIPLLRRSLYITFTSPFICILEMARAMWCFNFWGITLALVVFVIVVYTTCKRLQLEREVNLVRTNGSSNMKSYLIEKYPLLVEATEGVRRSLYQHYSVPWMHTYYNVSLLKYIVNDFKNWNAWSTDTCVEYILEFLFQGTFICIAYAMIEGFAKYLTETWPTASSIPAVILLLSAFMCLNMIYVLVESGNTNALLYTLVFLLSLSLTAQAQKMSQRDMSLEFFDHAPLLVTLNGGSLVYNPSHPGQETCTDVSFVESTHGKQIVTNNKVLFMRLYALHGLKDANVTAYKSTLPLNLIVPVTNSPQGLPMGDGVVVHTFVEPSCDSHFTQKDSWWYKNAPEIYELLNDFAVISNSRAFSKTVNAPATTLATFLMKQAGVDKYLSFWGMCRLTWWGISTSWWVVGSALCYLF